MQKLSPDALKEAQLEILDDLHNYCQALGLSYSLAGGSLLGAIRHKGFIPWDDDVDILMPRKDYELLINYLKDSRKYTIYNSREISSNYLNYLFSKISLNGTLVYESGVEKNYGINVDIFPIDGLGKSKSLAKFKFGTIVWLKKLHRIKSLHKYSSSYAVNLLLKIAKVFFLVFPRNFFLSMSESLAMKSDIGESNYAISIASVYLKKEFTSSDLYERYELYDFENRQYFGLSECDRYLKLIYGDYMKLPPEDKRQNHEIVAYSLI